MDAKLDCDVDVEGMVAVGAVDMMERGEERASISRRPCLRPSTVTAHSPLAQASFATPKECPSLWVFAAFPLVYCSYQMFSQSNSCLYFHSGSTTST
jgi:hypothetical protein